MGDAREGEQREGSEDRAKAHGNRTFNYTAASQVEIRGKKHQSFQYIAALQRLSRFAGGGGRTRTSHVASSVPSSVPSCGPPRSPPLVGPARAHGCLFERNGASRAPGRRLLLTLVQGAADQLPQARGAPVQRRRLHGL